MSNILSVRQLNGEKRQRAGVSCSKWHLPPTGYIKVNIDAAFFDDSMEMGLGFTTFDENEVHIYSLTRVMPGIYQPKEGEAIGLLEALSWIKDLNISKVVVEMDAKLVVDAVNGDTRDATIFGDIVEACKQELNLLQHCLVKWVNREANTLAHCLARKARNFSSSYCWVERPPFVDSLPNICLSCPV